MNKTAAEKLVELRGEKTQSEVANAIGVSQGALCMYESGERVPRDEKKIALANYYGVSVQEIFFD